MIAVSPQLHLDRHAVQPEHVDAILIGRDHSDLGDLVELSHIVDALDKRRFAAGEDWTWPLGPPAGRGMSYGGVVDGTRFMMQVTS